MVATEINIILSLRCLYIAATLVLYHNSGISASHEPLGMIKTQDETLRKDLTELGSAVRTFANKNDGLKQAIRIMEHKQENTEKALKNLDQKYESMMNMMAQMMVKLSDKGKDVDGNSCEAGSKEGDKKWEVQREAQGRCEPKENKAITNLPKMELPNFVSENPREWVRKANKYFKINGVEENMKSEIA